MRLTRDAIVESESQNKTSYSRFFEAFPQSFSDMDQLLSSSAYVEILKRSDEAWDFGNPYLRTMCEGYRHLDHHTYMMKLLMMGVDANNWGEVERLHNAGDNYNRLIWGYACEELTEDSRLARMRVIIDLLRHFDDREVEAIYNSLSWDGFTRFPLDWYLVQLCERYSTRCVLADQLRVRYLKRHSTGEGRAQ